MPHGPDGRGPKHSERTCRWRGLSPSRTEYTGPIARHGEQGQPRSAGFGVRRCAVVEWRGGWADARISCTGNRMTSGVDEAATGGVAPRAALAAKAGASWWRVRRAAATNARQPTTTEEIATIGRAMRRALANRVPPPGRQPFPGESRLGVPELGGEAPACRRPSPPTPRAVPTGSYRIVGAAARERCAR